LRRTAPAFAAALAAAALPATALGAGSGGSYGSVPPKVTGVSCVSDCDAVDVARAGSLVRITGANLASTASVSFLGGDAAGDEKQASPEKVSADQVDVRVPDGAVTGPVAVGAADGRVDRSAALLGIATGDVSLKPGPVDAKLAAKKVFYGAKRGAALTYVVRGNAPLPVRVDVVRRSDTTVVASWSKAAVVPGMPQTVEWNGLGGGKVATDGRYEFRIATGELATARSAAGQPPKPGATPVGNFLFLGFQFPIRGPHDYGTSINRFGASRGGGSRSHMGQDVMANCGLPLLAARGGVVSYRGYQSAAGNYLVIDSDQSEYDTVYMHLREPALVKTGQKVYTGQQIGIVGETGDATACHLHFELWDGPWYDGGTAIDPLSALKAWDKQS
jgi:Peptidase family M23